MGRGTYEKVLTFGFWPYEGRGVLVLSSTLTAVDDRVTVVRTLDEARAALTARGARQVYVDGGRVIQSFLRADLIDEVTTCWAPVLLGDGLRLFGQLDQDVHLRLSSSHASDGGMVHTTYHVHRTPPTG